MRELFYSLLKNYCRIALWFYYRKWQVHHHAPVPGGPVIFVANHQNAFLDAVLVGCSTHRHPWFLARANVFEKPWARAVLGCLKMRPVFRFRDGFATLRKNDSMIEGCVDLLKQNQSILIFAEGNHGDKWHLRPLQKGFAKIALAAYAKNITVNIVPVGLQYDSMEAVGSRVLVSFGKPISIHELATRCTEEKIQIDLLITQVTASLKTMMLHFEENSDERKISFLTHRLIKTDLLEQLESDQKEIERCEAKKDSLPAKNLVEAPIQHRPYQPFYILPFYFFNQLNHLLAKRIIRYVLKNKVKDPQFNGSLQFALGMILVPLGYLLQATLLFLILKSPGISLVYLVAAPLTFLLIRNTQRLSSEAQ